MYMKIKYTVLAIQRRQKYECTSVQNWKISSKGGLYSRVNNPQKFKSETKQPNAKNE